jgi:hypothetical protein
MNIYMQERMTEFIEQHQHCVDLDAFTTLFMYHSVPRERYDDGAKPMQGFTKLRAKFAERQLGLKKYYTDTIQLINEAQAKVTAYMLGNVPTIKIKKAPPDLSSDRPVIREIETKAGIVHAYLNPAVIPTCTGISTNLHSTYNRRLNVYDPEIIGEDEKLPMSRARLNFLIRTFNRRSPFAFGSSRGWNTEYTGLYPIASKIKVSWFDSTGQPSAGQHVMNDIHRNRRKMEDVKFIGTQSLFTVNKDTNRFDELSHFMQSTHCNGSFGFSNVSPDVYATRAYVSPRITAINYLLEQERTPKQEKDLDVLLHPGMLYYGMMIFRIYGLIHLYNALLGVSEGPNYRADFYKPQTDLEKWLHTLIMDHITEHNTLVDKMHAICEEMGCVIDLLERDPASVQVD